MSHGIHTELTFEAAIEESLLQHGGYRQGNSPNFDIHLGISSTHERGGKNSLDMVCSSNDSLTFDRLQMIR